ncbi:MAG: hypothetical protein IKW78_05530 [Prevotella sp.]|nr:hypothetical protein [Prevotella sp.]
MAVKHTINGIEFTDIKTSSKSFVPIINGEIYQCTTENLNEDFGSGNALPTIINAVEIDWNGAKPGFGEDDNGITTTGELLRQDFASVA